MAETPIPALDHLKTFYSTGVDHIGHDFFALCLQHCVNYDRAAGYFSSSALIDWSGALPRIIREQVKIRLLISPQLSVDDFETLSHIAPIQARSAFLDEHSAKIMDAVIAFANNPLDSPLRVRLLMWLIAAGQLELRFAIPAHSEDPGMFHDKSGVFYFGSGAHVGFVGSGNETFAAYNNNFERLHVFRSWLPSDSGHLEAVKTDFDRMWRGADGLLIVRPLTEQTMVSIRAAAPKSRPVGIEAEPLTDPRWRHQSDAREAFLRVGHGVLEMATGTGKTRTALSVCGALLDDKKIDGIVISADGTDLLDQWYVQLLSWFRSRTEAFRLFRHYAEHHECQLFALDTQRSVLIVSRSQLSKLFAVLPTKHRARLLIVHDEVHGLGSPQLRQELAGEHQAFTYRLGLSATPEREYDREGNDFIEREIGPIVFRFPLSEAIRRGVLAEFDYLALEYALTSGDRARLKAVYAKKAARAREGNPMSQEELWTDLARVYKTAENKPVVFAHFLRTRPEVLRGAIIFVEEVAYGDQLLPLLAQYTHLYRTYYADDQRENLLKFAAGRIDCLITCHRISQGIDIRRLRTVVLFAAARAKLETIQRIGRCLRIDPAQPDKRALVIDFVRDSAEHEVSGESADDERVAWLTELSRVRRDVAYAN